MAVQESFLRCTVCEREAEHEVVYAGRFVTQATAPPSTNAHTPMAPITRIPPGRIGTMIPTRPTAITNATRTMPTVLTPARVRGYGFLPRTH